MRKRRSIIYKDTCESVNRAIMADLFSGSSSNLQRLQLLKVWKGGRKDLSKEITTFNQSVTSVCQVLNKLILGGDNKGHIFRGNFDFNYLNFANVQKKDAEI